MKIPVRFLLFVGILLCLAMQPPIVPAVPRASPVVDTRVSGTTDQSQVGAGMYDFELLKYAFTQGGLTIVCLVVFAFYRRDFLRKQRDDAATASILITLVEKNTKAYGRLVAALDRRQFLAEDVDD